MQIACGTSNSSGDMFMNYMDYTNDGCMNLYSRQGQKARMIAAINQYRPNMLDHNLCSSTTNIYENQNTTKELIKIVDVLGKETNHPNLNATYFYIYNNGTVEKKIIVK